jgi:hypothetical protein
MTRTLKNAPALCAGADTHDPPVFGVGGSPDETVLLESVDDRAHRRRANLLGRGQLADRPGAAEHEDGQGREAGGAEAAGVVLPSRVAERMDRRRVKAIRCS